MNKQQKKDYNSIIKSIDFDIKTPKPKPKQKQTKHFIDFHIKHFEFDTRFGLEAMRKARKHQKRIHDIFIKF